MRQNTRPQAVHAARLVVSAALAALLALPAAGCKTTDGDITGSLGLARADPQPAAPRTEAGWRQQMAVWGPRYRANQGDARAAIAYADALRHIGQRAQAVAVLQTASIRNPHNKKVLGAYGRALADAGRLKEALDALTRAHTPDNPDWRILNAQGAVLDQMGRHRDAQRHYRAALNLMPNEPSVLSNLGLSYALEKRLKQAETVLRQAAAQPSAAPKVRQNLALVVGLEGRFAEAERIASADLPPKEAQANIAYLRKMLAKKNAFSAGKERPPYVPAPKAGT
ncbi:MAG: tetratricopeptide repeat protein [Pseudolabrys sp.]